MNLQNFYKKNMLILIANFDHSGSFGINRDNSD